MLWRSWEIQFAVFEQHLISSNLQLLPFVGKITDDLQKIKYGWNEIDILPGKKEILSHTDSILVLVIKVHIAGRPGNKGGRAHKIFSLLCAHTLSQKLANMRVWNVKTNERVKILCSYCHQCNSARVVVDFGFSDLVSKDAFIWSWVRLHNKPPSWRWKTDWRFCSNQIKLNLSQSIQPDNKPTKFT